jgi:fructose-bisphosphate aldolase, class II
MALVTTAEMVGATHRDGCGITAYNVIKLEHAEAIVAAADRIDKPIILQVSENAVRFHHGQVEPILTAVRAVAAQADVPVAVHLDHVEHAELLYAAGEVGASSVMFDASKLDYDTNVAATRAAAEWAHDRGCSWQPSSAKSAANTAARAWAAHGSSGVSGDDLHRAVRAGITKINVGTILNVAFTAAVRERLADTEVVDPPKYLAPARDAIADTAIAITAVVSAPAGSSRRPRVNPCTERTSRPVARGRASLPACDRRPILPATVNNLSHEPLHFL